MAHYAAMQDKAVAGFVQKVDATQYAGQITSENTTAVILFGEALKQAKRGVKDKETSAAINEDFQAKNPIYYAVVKRVGKDGKKLNRETEKSHQGS